MAHGLWSSNRGKADPRPRLYVVDTSEQWLENTRRKMPVELEPYIEFRHARATAGRLHSELCHYFEDLPNIRPKLIYLDGPDPATVDGRVNGLGFTMENGKSRPPISADLLLYESTLTRGTTVVIDGRGSNATFLRSHLKRRWRFESDPAQQRSVFTLLK